jgi:superfamily II DNA or RNA helicase
MTLTKEKLELIISLFKRREDVFARRWERSDKSGYAPAYDFDQQRYAHFKTFGGTLKDFPDKQYSRLTSEVYTEHLTGKETIGIYPLLEDNTSWFLAFDFDKQDWQTEVVGFYQQCQLFDLPAYIERSRSGNGGHIWIFYESPYPALKSRKIGQLLLQKAGLLSKSTSNSFDRIFPNQDFLSGKGLGNLIALPLQGEALKSGNTAFLDATSLQVADEQWNFLKQVKKVSSSRLEEILRDSVESYQPAPLSVRAGNLNKSEVGITLGNQVTVTRSGLPADAVLFLRQSLKITNPNYFVRKATGQSTHGIRASDTTLIEDANQLSFPRGFIGTFLRYCKQHNVEYAFDERREKLPEVDFSPKGRLRDYQRPAVDSAAKKDFGVIVLPPGSGKTIIGLQIIAEKKQPALIIVHRRQLFDQWIERIQSFLGIPRHKIGRIKSGLTVVGDQVTVAMIQSLQQPEAREKIERSFGLIIVDECHHVPSATYREVLQQLHTWHIYGLTATSVRKNKDEQLIFHQLGELIYEMPKRENKSAANEIVLNIRDTDFQVPFNVATDDIETIFQVLIHDSERNELIADDVRLEIDRSRMVIILTERVAHLQLLNQYLKQKFETIVLSGEDSEDARRNKFRMISEGRFQVLITTGQFLGEGIDIDHLDCLILAYPCSFEGKLIQYIGRVQRGDISPVIYDYRDLRMPFLEKMFQQRNRHYMSLRNSGLVGEYEEYLLRFEGDRFYFANGVNALPISVLQLGLDVESFVTGIAWKIRVLKYEEESKSVFVEVVDYNALHFDQKIQLLLSYLSVEQIRFRTLDTVGLLKSVVLKKSTHPQVSSIANDWHLFEKTVKIPFKKIRFENGCVSFPYYFPALKKEIALEIPNPAIRSEFQAVSDYFRKVLALHSIPVELKIRYSKRYWKIISYEATSIEIAAIDAEIIDTVRFEFVQNRLMKFRPKPDDEAVQTFEKLEQTNPDIQNLIEDENALLYQLLKVESARHFLQLRHLASLHEASILKLRFVLQPFSFLFLLSGEKQYHIIWETLDTDEATYLWHIEKSKPALRVAVVQIEEALTEMKKTGRQEYLKKELPNFTRIVHDYSDPKRGFALWRGLLEERLV